MHKQFFSNAARPHVRLLARRHRGVNTCLLLVLVLSLIRLISLQSSYRRALVSKYCETDFTTLGMHDEQLLHPDQRSKILPDPVFRSATNGSRFLDDRYVYEHDLGSGWEGWTKVYLDRQSNSPVVVKTFNIKHSPLRNHVPTSLAQTFYNQRYWPSEIPAALLLGGFTGNATSADKTSNAQILETSPGHDVVPILDYFLASDTSQCVEDQQMQWYMVMPLIHGGNLRHLSKNLREWKRNTFREIDTSFRPVFRRLLTTLEYLHAEGMCHDDVSDGNIFVQSEDSWLLGDLGSVREFSHPYHTSRIWQDAQQLPRCDFNDVHRALKVYLSFIRNACTDPDAFDREFYAGAEPWSRLYWSFVAAPMPAAMLKMYSDDREPAKATPHIVTSSARHQPRLFPMNLLIGSHRTLQRAVTKELSTGLSDSFARKISLTWFFDIEH